jgi:hypothetical protein
MPDVAYFRGAPDPVSTSQRILYHNEEYHPPFWGHAVFLNLKQHLIIPDYVGYQDTIVASIYPPIRSPSAWPATKGRWPGMPTKRERISR